MFRERERDRDRERFSKDRDSRGDRESGGARGSRTSRLPRKRSAKFVISRDVKIDYKNIALLQKFVSERGKILSRRNTGVSGSEQRQISEAVKRARFLGLLSVGSAKRKY